MVMEHLVPAIRYVMTAYLVAFSPFSTKCTLARNERNLPIGTLKEPFFPGSLKKAVHDDPYLTLGTACNWPDLLIGRVDL